MAADARPQVAGGANQKFEDCDRSRHADTCARTDTQRARDVLFGHGDCSRRADLPGAASILGFQETLYNLATARHRFAVYRIIAALLVNVSVGWNLE